MNLLKFSYLLQSFLTSGGNQAFNEAKTFNMETNTWTAQTPMPIGLQEHACVFWQGEIYVIGGKMDGIHQNTQLNDIVYIYNLSTRVWRTGAHRIASPMC